MRMHKGCQEMDGFRRHAQKSFSEWHFGDPPEQSVLNTNKSGEKRPQPIKPEGFVLAVRHHNVSVVAVSSDLFGERELGTPHIAPQLTCDGEHRQTPWKRSSTKTTRERHSF